MKNLIKNQTNAMIRVSRKMNFTTVFSFALLLCIVLSSCSKDDAPTQKDEQEILPTLILQSGSTETFEGVIGSPVSGTLNYTIKADTPEIFKQLVISKIVDNVETHFETINSDHPDFIANSTSFTYTLNHELLNGNVNSTISFKAIVTDGAGNTSSLNFASAIVKEPLMSEYLVLRVENPVIGVQSTPYFLYANDGILKTENITGVTDENADTNIFAVLSYNDGSGLYFSAPNTTLESQLTADFSVLQTTKFKEQAFGLEGFEDYTIYDVYEMEDLFNAVPFNSHEEKAEGLAPEKVYSFSTFQGKSGLIHIREVEVVNGEFYVDVEVLMEQ